MSLQSTILNTLTVNQLKNIQNILPKSKQIIILKLSAEWCGPCKAIKKQCYEEIENLPENVIVVDIDVDDELDLFMALKTKKMVKGIPALLAWYPNEDREHWFIPDNSISGSNKKDIALFFSLCKKTALKLL